METAKGWHRIQALTRLLGPGVRMPTFVMMFVTNRCDAKCPHCFYWRELNTKAKQELTIDEFDELSRSIGPVLQVTLTGGSPELRRDLPEIAESFSRNCRPSNITICVNGYHTKRILQHVEKTMETCPGQGMTVSVSLDGIGEDHSSFRGMKGLFERVVDTFHGLAEIKKKYPNLRVQCGMCVTGLNYVNIEEAAHWAWENLPLDYLKVTLVRQSPPPPKEEALDEGCTREYLRMIDAEERWIRPVRGPGTSARALVAMAKEVVLRQVFRERIESGQCPIRCGASRENVTIYPDGTVAGCECRSERLGSLRDVGMDLSKIWYGSATRDFRDTLQREGCANHHHGYLALPVLRSPAMWPRLARAAWKIRNGTGEPSTTSR